MEILSGPFNPFNLSFLWSNFGPTSVTFPVVNRPFSDFLSSDDMLIGPELETQIRYAQGRRKSSSALIVQDEKRRNSRFWEFLAARSDRKTQNLDLSKIFFRTRRAISHFYSRVWCTF